MMMLEDLRLALRQIYQAIGLSGNAATVVSLIVLGAALNLTALRAVEYVGIGRHACHDRTALQSAAQTELKVMRSVAVSTLKKISDGGRKLCLARQWIKDRQTAWATPRVSEGCDVEIASRHHGKVMIVSAQC
jgi:hypothetical protein